MGITTGGTIADLNDLAERVRTALEDIDGTQEDVSTHEDPLIANLASSAQAAHDALDELLTALRNTLGEELRNR